MASAVHPGKKASAGTRAVGRYELKEKLGEGGMGVVWRALDSRIGGDVALKIMKDVSDPAALELFSKEWRALAELSHPNIVDVRDVDVLVEEGKQKPFFIMPLLRGATLSDLIKGSSERLTVTRVVEIMSQVCRGLQAAHQRGLVHRDLKPSNIFVMDDDTAKVIDFGVVYLAGTHSVTGLKGTYQYMSPEQMQMKEVTPASDLFSLGVILYESLTGRKPFARATPGETATAVQHHVPPPVSELNPGIPHQVGQVVHKCLAKQAIHRFGSARELAEMLQRACRGEEVFDSSKLRVRLERVKTALKTDEGFASELLSELESEGHLDSEISMLRTQIDGWIKARKVRQLIESARARIEQGEIALGLDKLREALELDPENAEARGLKAATENKRSEAQAERWVELGRTHLDNCDFGAARHAVQEALASRAGDVRALELLNRIETVEGDAKRVREQKEQLYNTAMKAYQNGEIDSAMSRMVRLFSVVRSRPEGAVPERDAVYESFYQQVRSEHDSIRLLLEQAQHEFSEENFQEALRLCGEHLARYPHDGAFQALKIQIEDAERQQVSSYIAMVTKSADAEPDLDRRANILREASEKYPQEGQFAQQLKVVRERRDLVNSIVAKARQFQERGQYSEALSQWDMLRSIHPRYPGLSFELEQCRKKRDQQAEEEEKARLVEEIVRLMEDRDYAKGLDRARQALQEFGGDAELVGLERLCADGLERGKEAGRLLTLGQAEAAAQNWEESGEYLRKALKLDGRNLAVKEALIYTLTEHARTVLETDWMAAQRLQEEAAALDAQHRAVRTLGTEISEARRQTYVGECLTEARTLVSEGKQDAAYELIRKGREEYRSDIRLEQYEAWLVKENDQLRVKQERERRLAELAAAGKALERNPDSERAREVLRRSRDLGMQAPDDPQAMRGIAEAEQTVRRTMQVDDLSVLLQAETEAPRMLAQAALVESTQATRLERPAGRKKAGTAGEVAKPVRQKTPVLPARVAARSRMIAAIGALTLLIVGTALLFQSIARRTAAKHGASAPGAAAALVPARVRVSVTPADSTVRVAGTSVDGAGVSGNEVTVPAGRMVTVEVSRAGYRTAKLMLDGRTTQQTAVLEALPVRVSLALGAMRGEVALDGKKVGELGDGAFEVDVPADGNSHTLALLAGNKRMGGLVVKASAGMKPELEPISDNDVLTVASMGSATTVYGGEQLRNAQMNGVAVRLSDKGTDLPALTDGANELTYVVGNETASLSLAPTDGPAVQVHALAAGATMLVTSSVDAASLTVNGKPVKRGRGGWQITQPGAYQFAMGAVGYETQTWTAVLKPRQSLIDSRKLVAKAAAPVAAITAQLVVAGGTPGAQVRVDGRVVGELNESGAGQFSGISAGSHGLAFHKDGFCDGESEVVARPPAELRASNGRLEPCGSLTLKGEATSVTVRRVGDAGGRWIELVAGHRTQLPVGKYEAHVEFAGGRTVDLPDLNVEAGREAEFAPHPVAAVRAANCQLQTASDASVSGEWLKRNGKGLMLVTRGCVSGVSLTFGKPEGGLLKSKKMEWVVRAGGGNGQIAYEIDGGKLRRQSSVHGADERAEGSADKLKLDDGTFKVRIQVEGQHIRIVGPGGEVVDDYDAQDPSLINLRGGQLGVKTGGEFKLSGGGA